jgi:hypothetical protein
MFEKSIHAMNNVNPTENDNEENSIRTHSNQVNSSSRKSGIKTTKWKCISEKSNIKTIMYYFLNFTVSFF